MTYQVRRTINDTRRESDTYFFLTRTTMTMIIIRRMTIPATTHRAMAHTGKTSGVAVVCSTGGGRVVSYKDRIREDVE